MAESSEKLSRTCKYSDSTWNACTAGQFSVKLKSQRALSNRNISRKYIYICIYKLRGTVTESKIRKENRTLKKFPSSTWIPRSICMSNAWRSSVKIGSMSCNLKQFLFSGVDIQQPAITKYLCDSCKKITMKWKNKEKASLHNHLDTLEKYMF